MARAQRKVIDVKPERHIKPEPVMDDIFFHKSQVGFGARLVCVGRLNEATTWEVVGIESHFLGDKVGQVNLKKVNKIRYLNDIISIKNVETGQTKKLPFIYMSYSAIWRLV